jgi:hypothetical protein
MSFWGKLTGSEKQSTSYKGYGGSANTAPKSSPKSSPAPAPRHRDSYVPPTPTIRPTPVNSSSKVAVMENAPLPVFREMAPVEPLLTPTHSFSNSYATIEDAPIPVFSQMKPPESSFGGFHEKIKTHIVPETKRVNGVIVEDSEGRASDGNVGFTDEEIVKGLSDPEDKTVKGITELLKIQDPEASWPNRLGRALKIRAATAPADFFLDNISNLVGIVNPIAGLALNLSSEPTQRALDDRSRGNSLLSDVGQTIKESPGTILAATVEGGYLIGSLVQHGIDTNLGKIPDKSIGDIMAGPILGPMIGGAVSEISPFDNPYLNMATQIGLTVAGVEYGGRVIDNLAGAPSSGTFNVGGQSLLAGTSPQGNGGGNTSSVQSSGVVVGGGSSQFISPFFSDSMDTPPVNYKGGFSSSSEKEEDDTLFANPFASKVSRKENKGVSGTRAFDSSMQQTNLLGFGTGQMLSLDEDPNDQFSTRQRTSGGQYEEDTVSFLARRSI